MWGRGDESESESEGDIDLPLPQFERHFQSCPHLIRAFLFDIGNVLLRFDFSLALRAVAEHSEVQDETEVLARIDRVKLSYEDGQIDRAAFLRGVLDVLRYRGTEAQFVAAWEEIFSPNEPMFTLVTQLAQTHPLYLLSNTSDIHRDYIFRTYEVFRNFTAGTYSYSARSSKPGRAIYEQACREHGLEPATTFFIDDLLPNIETARALGFVAHHYHLDRHDALLADLRSAGI
jgi:putative hydrolase of the HAD superfamily